MQLSGSEFTLDHSAELPPEQKRLIETIMTLPGRTLEEEICRRNAAIKAAGTSPSQSRIKQAGAGYAE